MSEKNRGRIKYLYSKLRVCECGIDDSNWVIYDFKTVNTSGNPTITFNEGDPILEEKFYRLENGKKVKSKTMWCTTCKDNKCDPWHDYWL